MPYVCLECWEVFNEKFDNCPKANCTGSVVQIDELMFPIIKILNSKGYYTNYCCSGHVYDEYCSPYVLFTSYVRLFYEDEELMDIFSDLPEGWSYTFTDDSFSLNANVSKDDEITMYKKIIELNTALLEYVDKLPPLEY